MDTSQIVFGSKEHQTNSKESRLHIPDTRSAIKRCSCQIIAFVVSFSTVSFLSFCLLLILQLIIVGYWADTYNNLTERMPKSFAWEILIPMYGSLYNDCTDRSGPQPIHLTVSEHCPRDFTMPPIPITAMTLLIGSAISGIFCFILGCVYKQASTLAIRSLWMFTFVKFVLFMGAVIPISLSFSGNKGVSTRLESRMSSEMKMSISPTDISPRWELSQLTYQCCGMRDYTDWNFIAFAKEGNPRYPRSCCDQSKSHCKFFPNRTEVYQKGCLDFEFKRVEKNGMLAIYLLCLGLISTVLMTILLTIIHTIYQGDETQEVTFCRKNNRNINSSTNPLPSSSSNHQSLLLASTHLGGGDQSSILSLANPENNNPNINTKTWKLLSLRRNTNINVRVNGWGIHVHSRTTSLAHSEILKRETIV